MKRHSAEEIQAKLRDAHELEQRGQSQAEICKALGISVMTFHRWRKDPPEPNSRPGEGDGCDAAINGTSNEIETLRTENQRLRKIVTDLLLEKAGIEETIARHRTNASGSNRRARSTS